MIQASVSCFLLFMQLIARARSFERCKAGNSSEARITMMPMTTSNSTRVKPVRAPLSNNWRGGPTVGAWGPITFCDFAITRSMERTVCESAERLPQAASDVKKHLQPFLRKNYRIYTGGVGQRNSRRNL